MWWGCGERVQYDMDWGILQPPSGQFSNRPSHLPVQSQDHRSLLMQEEHWSEYAPDPCHTHRQVPSGTPCGWRNRSQCRCSWCVQVVCVERVQYGTGSRCCATPIVPVVRVSYQFAQPHGESSQLPTENSPPQTDQGSCPHRF